MSNQEREELFCKVFKDSKCPENLAKEASKIATKYYPLGLSGASSEEIAIYRKAKSYLKDD